VQFIAINPLIGYSRVIPLDIFIDVYVLPALGWA